MKRVLLAAFASVLLLGGAAQAADYTLGDITVSDVWARASLGQAPNSAAYLTVHNHGTTADRLVGVETDAAAKPELHTVEMADGVMKMRPLEGIDLPAGGEATLAIGGNHVMLMGLKAPLQAGENFPLTLIFEKAGRLTVEAEVRALNAQMNNQGGMPHGEMPEMKHKRGTE